MTNRKKLIEVALPLPEINDASAYDKMPGIGPHPKGIHHWWARLPLPTARAILFASVIDDPSEHPEKFETEAAQDKERERLFGIVRRMMQKKLHTHPEVYAEARAEMEKYCDGKLPAVLDPFSGGGSIPLEANRLGFEAHAADLNPVAVLLNKCNLELAPRWSGHAPVNAEDRSKIGGGQGWDGTTGLAADVRYYAQRIKKTAEEKLKKLYPKAALPVELGGGHADVVAWLWARTVRSDNAAARGKHVPLVSTYFLATGKGKEVYLEPEVNKIAGTYHFVVHEGTPADKPAIRAGTKLGRGAKFKCLLTDTPISSAHIKAEGQAGRLGYKLLAVVAERRGGKFYQAANTLHETTANVPVPDDVPDEEMANDPRNIWCAGYGFRRFSQLFTPRQLTGLLTFSRLIRAIHPEIVADATRAGLSVEAAQAYATTVVTFLALALDRCADFGNAQTRWSPSNQKVMNLFSKQAIPMSWDFAEANILANSVGGWTTCSDYVAECIQTLYPGPALAGSARQIDAASGAHGIRNLVVSTDPPYYDNMSYASLSDFFYVWLRRTLGDLHRELCSTIVVPKMPELIADAARFGGDRNRARDHFENGFRSTFSFLHDRLDPRYPLTVYYAFKQEDEVGDANIEQEGEDVAVTIDLTTGWETLLEALISSGFQITATWPVRASQAWRQVSMGTNALASYIVLACRSRAKDAPQTGRREFMAELKRELPVALRHLQQGNVAPVDFAQAAIGPGMAVFSRFTKVVETDGSRMTVRTALGLINKMLDEVLAEQEGEFDSDTRWALAWFDQHGFAEGPFGDAETLCKAKDTSVSGMVEAGIILAKAGKVRLLRRDELPANWDPARDKRLTIWECTHQMVRALAAGEKKAADLLRLLGSHSQPTHDLSYRLYNICERRKWAQEALGYNALALAWGDLQRLASEAAAEPQQVEGELNLGA